MCEFLCDFRMQKLWLYLRVPVNCIVNKLLLKVSVFIMGWKLCSVLCNCVLLGSCIWGTSVLVELQVVFMCHIWLILIPFRTFAIHLDFTVRDFMAGCCTIMIYVAPSLADSHICYSSLCTSVYITSPLSTSWWMSWFSNLQAGCSPGMLFLLARVVYLQPYLIWYCMFPTDCTFLLCSTYINSYKKKTISWLWLADACVQSCACLEWFSNLDLSLCSGVLCFQVTWQHHSVRAEAVTHL
jgi:hypothetical protein